MEGNMKKGVAASGGYAAGRIFLKKVNQISIPVKFNADPNEEKKRLDQAVNASKRQLSELKDTAAVEIGEEEAKVFFSHLMILHDPEFIGEIISRIESDKISAEAAISEIVNKYIEIFALIDDEYIKERTADVKDVEARILKNLAGIEGDEFSDLPENSIIAAHDLTPSDTVQMGRKRVAAFITDVGSSTSHSAIMARTLEIPAVVGLGNITSSVKTGDFAIVDGVQGIVLINPGEEELKKFENKKSKMQEEKFKLKNLVNMRTVTNSGKKIIVAGNIGLPGDVSKVIENGGEGVGLFRTEFLYMDRDNLPEEEEQFEAYKYVAEKLGDKPVVIRTLDIGGDKKLPYLHIPEEINPFLGYRAIRLCLDEHHIFKTQLRAIIRASAYGNVKLMFPMISSLEELLKAKQVLGQCMEELSVSNIKYNRDMEVGIMVEIPSAAIMADELAKHVDFFSIGINDLVQYTLAADRMNEKVAHIYNPMHPAILKLIKMTIEAAHKEGKWCGMCGEMAGDEKAIPLLLEYGLDEFSMSASSILKAKKIIINS
jgi:phosphoenolpyruvate-protein phosphotransferase (PTS system enzyme I)